MSPGRALKSRDGIITSPNIRPGRVLTLITLPDVRFWLLSGERPPLKKDATALKISPDVSLRLPSGHVHFHGELNVGDLHSEAIGSIKLRKLDAARGKHLQVVGFNRLSSTVIIVTGVEIRWTTARVSTCRQLIQSVMISTGLVVVSI